MATFPGNVPSTFWWLNNADVSSNLQPTPLAFDGLTRALKASGPVSQNTTVHNTPIDVEGALGGVTGIGFQFPTHGQYWFERIHVLPARKSYPFILSPLHLFVEVYNAYRNASQTVTDVIETGPAGVTILTPHVPPIVFGPLESKIYDILVDAVGAPRADNFITWDFAGLEEPTLHLTGLRLLPFTIPPDWADGIDDIMAFATDVMTAYDDTEQRMMLRIVANRTLAYKAAALDTRENGLLASLLWSWQSRSYGVLLWMDGRPLQADVVAGSVDLLVDTTDMDIQPGDTVIVITDAFNWFASPVEELTAGSIKLETVLDRDFFGGRTEVIPVILGRVAEAVDMTRPTNASAISQIKFDLQVVET